MLAGKLVLSQGGAVDLDARHIHSAAGLQTYVVGPPRPLAAIKDTNWVADRKPIAAQVPAHAIEGLLQTADGGLLEGLVTNLFVIRAALRAVATAAFDAMRGCMPS